MLFVPTRKHQQSYKRLSCSHIGVQVIFGDLHPSSVNSSIPLPTYPNKAHLKHMAFYLGSATPLKHSMAIAGFNGR
jgi:hypothetical protein